MEAARAGPAAAGGKEGKTDGDVQGDMGAAGGAQLRPRAVTAAGGGGLAAGGAALPTRAHL